MHKLIFVDEDFILMDFDNNYEIIYHVPSQRTVASFNSLNRHLRYNEMYFATVFSLSDSLGQNLFSMGTGIGTRKLHEQRTSTALSQNSPIANRNSEDLLMSRRLSISGGMRRNLLETTRVQSNFNTDKTRSRKSSSFSSIMLEDFIYLNMKR